MTARSADFTTPAFHGFIDKSLCFVRLAWNGAYITEIMMLWAWTALKPYLLPDEVTPVAAPAPAPAPKAAAAAAPAVRSASTTRVGTGLSNADTFNDEPVTAPATVQGVKLIIDGKQVVMDLRGWERQSSDLQKRVLRNASNASAIDALYRADDEQKAARGGRR